MDVIQGRQQAIRFAAVMSIACYDIASGRRSAHETEVRRRLHNLRVIRNENALCVVGIDGSRRCWVAFEGSDTATDWKHNLNAELVPSVAVPFGGKIHRGFDDHANKLDDQLEDYIRSLSPTPDQFILCGHSLGAAVAIRFGSKWWKNWIMRSGEVIAFATPRVVNCKAAYRIDHIVEIPITRINNLSDLIDHAPPHSPGGYCHVGRGLFLDAKGRMTTEDRHIIARSARVLWQWARMFFPWEAHSSHEYLRRIDRWIERERQGV